ncbi:MAG: electron transfer flavoprotein subunit alpha/FixB family protein [Microthrixaceae bacterium]|nr:electron transfer flavoprotein subunit alpha/FixB family protein [Microthrixaceae bacterium]
MGVDVSDHDGDPAVAAAVATLAVEHDCSIVAVAGGTTAEDLAARVAASTDGLLALDTRAVTSCASGLRVHRPAFGGAFDAEIEVGRSRRLVVTFDPGSVTGGPPLAAIGMLTIEPSPGPVRLVEQRHEDEALPLSRARRVVAGGRGIGGPEGFTELGKLADALGAAMAASRPPCDAGWVPGHHQVGITGARVAPELYVAVGISGSVQHRAGMHSAQTVVAINTDPEAPILRHADLAVVGDWREVVAGMLEVLSDDATPPSRQHAGQPIGAER